MEKKQFELKGRSDKRKNRKHFLQEEIAKETDPHLKLEYTKMLLAIEKDEKNKKRMGWGLFFLFIIGFTYFLYTLGDKSSGQARKERNEVAQAQSSEGDQGYQQDTQVTMETYEVTTEAKAKELTLSTTEIKSWVLAVLDLEPTPARHYILDVAVDKADDLVYIDVTVNKMGNLGTFRINGEGQLEARGAITGSLTDPNWILMSDEYMDLTIAKAYFASQSSRHHLTDSVSSFEEAKDLVEENMNLWTDVARDELADLEIESFNNHLNELKSSSSGDYYTVVAETNRDSHGHGYMNNGFQFRVYEDGSIEQRSMGSGRDMWIKIK